MSATGFSIGVAAGVTGLTQRQIRHLSATGVLRPSVRAPNGRGSVARYSYFDVVRMKVIERLRAAGDVPPERLARAMAELGKVRDGGWSERVLYTTDWESFELTADARQLASELTARPLTVAVGLGAVDAEVREALARMSLGAPVAA